MISRVSQLKPRTPTPLIRIHARFQQFNGQHGRAFLFEAVSNIVEGPAEDRTMTTGLHTVRDISCGKCEAVLGWKYVSLSLGLSLCTREAIRTAHESG